MATAREESTFGAGGKFKKRPFRRQTTPYDRPPTALRNSSNVNINNNNGWLSKLIDPAQKLIASGAQRFFSSVFRKRLPPPPPPVPEPNHEAKDVHQERSKDISGVQGAINCHDDASNSFDGGQLTELEQILKQKTFTRSEIDRLTSLLRSKTGDMTVEDEHKRPEVIPSKVIVSHNKNEMDFSTPLKENGIESQPVSTPVVSSRVLNDDVASPAQLAKAYMSSRPFQVTPTITGLRSQASREEFNSGFVTPRSRGRSAIYSMARTPYSRVHSTNALKGATTAYDSVPGPSSSRSAWENNRLTGSKQGTLKRRSSVLESDIGSVGPIRRIRQKPNLLSSKMLSLPAVGDPLTQRATGTLNDDKNPSSSMQKPLLLGEPKNTLARMARENGDNSIPSTSFTPIPSKSSEMASKILQQLDKLVSSKEKSPMKLSTSMLSGPALKSLENVDSSILLEKVQDNNKSNGPTETSLPDARDSTSRLRDKIEENGPKKPISPVDKPKSSMNGSNTSVTFKDFVPSTKPTDSAVKNSAHAHPLKKRAFQMSAHEDYLDIDDDDHPDAPVSTPSAELMDKPLSFVSENKAAAELTKLEKHSALADIKPPSFGLKNTSDMGTSDGSVPAKSSVFAFATVPSLSKTVQPAAETTAPALTFNKAPSANESKGAPIFSFSEKAASPKESNLVSSTVGPGTVHEHKVPQFASTSLTAVSVSSVKTGSSFDLKPESSSRFTSAAAGASDSVEKVPESEADDETVSKGGVFSRLSEASSSAPSTSSSASPFSSGISANSLSGLNNGSVAASSSSISSAVAPLFSNASSNQNTFSSSTSAFATNNNGGATATNTTTISTETPVFKFGSSAVPSTSFSSSSGLESTQAKTKDTSVGNSTSNLFGSTSAFTSTGNSIFGGTSSTGTGSSLFANTSSASTGTGSTIFAGTASSSTGTGSSFFTGTSSTTTGLGSSIFTGSSSLANTGSSVFGTTASATSSSGSTFGFSASAAANQSQIANPFGAGTTQASNGTVTTSTQSTAFQFGSSASSTPFGSAVNSSSSLPFGSAVNSSSSSPFGSAVNSSSSSLFGSAVNSSSSSPFGSVQSVANPFSSGPTFGLSSSTTSSAANSVSSSSGNSSSIFGTPAFNSSTPSTGFAFGASASSAAVSSTPIFGSSTSTMSSSMFSFTSSPAAPPAQPAFGSANSVFAFGSAPANNNNNNDQMNMEDSMAEDTVQGTTLSVPVFGQQQPATPPQSGFLFGSTTPGTNPFQFGGQPSQPNMAVSQNPASPFQASSSLEFNAAGTFSLGSGGVEKSQRRIVKVKHKQRGKK